jgi:hypothetical protein
VNTVTHKQNRVECDAKKDGGRSAEDSSGQSETDPKAVKCHVLTVSGQNVEGSSGQRNTGATGRTVRGFDIHWTHCRKQQWIRRHRNKDGKVCVLTDIREALEDSIGHRDTEPTLRTE